MITALSMLSLLMAGLLACNRIVETDRIPRNVLIVSIDTLRADRIGAYGDEGAHTPTLDRLASTGVRFDAAFSPAPLTLPSHSTLLTGLDPDRHGVRHNGIHRLADEAVTLGERFSEAGYATAASVGSLVLTGQSGLDQGFQHYDDRISSASDHATAARRASEVNTAAMDWLDGVEDGFFLFVHYYDPHRPYDPPLPWAETARSPYDGEIAYADAMLAELLAELEKRGLFEDTLIVVTSDHGESLGEHDELTHGHGIYDATQRVPLILHGPGVPSGVAVRDVVRTADIAPTVLARIDLPELDGIDGRDLAALWTETPSAPRVAYLDSMATRYDQGWNPLRGLRSAGYLYVESPEPELYDTRVDPDQLVNLYGKETSDLVEPLRDLEATLAARQKTGVTAAELDLDATTRAQLHALGYAIPETPHAANGIDAKIGRKSLALFHEGDALYQAGRALEAVGRFEAMLELSPDSGEAWISLGAARLDAKDLEGAKEATRRGIELMPERGSARLQLGVIEMALGRPSAAEVAFREAIELEPEAPGPRGRLLRALLAQGRIEEAIELDREISALDWTHEIWLRRIADLWEAHGRTELALAAYQRVLAVAPHSQRDHMHAAIALIRLGRVDEARAHLEQSGDVVSQPRAREALRKSYLEAGLHEAAKALDAAKWADS